MCYRESMQRFFKSLVLIGAALFGSGCGYHLVGATSFLPDELKILYVEPFQNQSTWSDMDQRLAEAISQEWVRRRRFQLVNTAEEADVALKGVISAVSTSPVTFDDNGRATEYQMTLRVAVQLVDVRGDKPEVLWEDKGFSRRTSYDVDVSAVNYFDRQVEAMDGLSREFARSLVSAVMEGF